ncbi:MAG: aldehyde dehydrogenase family protein, partial [Akkermansiaceae bacterium]|nr:aldehyde dehydrogenase family protein [Akkermansiaceae bacterium]
MDDALNHGAQVLCGGAPPSHLPHGSFFAPTLLANATSGMRIFREETFCTCDSLVPVRSPSQPV